MQFEIRYLEALLTVVLYAAGGWALMWDLARRQRLIHHITARPHTPEEWTRAAVQVLLVVGWSAVWPGGPLWIFAWA
jgi:hypothetical protein